MRGHRPLWRSFGHAWDGLVEGAVRDRNLRIHLGIGVLVGAFAARAPFSQAERALLVLCVAAVIATEAMNCAIEAAVDLASPRLDERARIAKDSAAAAVLAVSAGSVLVFLTVSAGRLGELSAWARRLGAGGAAGLAAAAAVAAAAAMGLAAPGRRVGAVDTLVLLAGVAALVLVAAGAVSQLGTATAALCLAVGAAAAARRRR